MSLWQKLELEKMEEALKYKFDPSVDVAASVAEAKASEAFNTAGQAGAPSAAPGSDDTWETNETDEDYEGNQ